MKQVCGVTEVCAPLSDLGFGAGGGDWGRRVNGIS